MIRYRRTISVSLAAALSVLLVGVVRAEPPGAPAKSGAASCARSDFRVVLDVGHTAKSPGAKSARGVDEFDFNLRLAKQIDQALLEAGFAKTVLMVTDGPGIRSMYARVARANELSANLLLSIHHDSVPNRFLEKWDYNGKPETFSDRFKGHSIFVSDGNLDPKDSLSVRQHAWPAVEGAGLAIHAALHRELHGPVATRAPGRHCRRLSLRHAVRAEEDATPRCTT